MGSAFSMRSQGTWPQNEGINDECSRDVDSVFAKNYTYKLCTTVPYCDRRSTRIQTRPKCHRDCSSSRISTPSIVLNYLLVPSVNEEYRKCSTPLSCASTFPTTTDPSLAFSTSKSGTTCKWSVDKILSHQGSHADVKFEVLWMSGDKTWLRYGEISLATSK